VAKIEKLELPGQIKVISIFGLDYKFSFTEDEEESLRDVLKNYDSDVVEQFISVLGELCRKKISIIKNPNISESYKEIGRMLRSFKRALPYLKDLTEFQKLHHFPKRVDDTSGAHYDSVLKVADNAGHAYFPLLSLVEIFEKAVKTDKRPRGRPEVDTDNFIYSVAKLFTFCFEKPTTYEEGPFADVVRITLESMELPAEAPSRSITKAIKRLKKEDLSKVKSPFFIFSIFA